MTPSNTSILEHLQNTTTWNLFDCCIYLPISIIYVSEPPTPFVRISLPVHSENPPSATKQKYGLWYLKGYRLNGFILFKLTNILCHDTITLYWSASGLLFCKNSVVTFSPRIKSLNK